MHSVVADLGRAVLCNVVSQPSRDFTAEKLSHLLWTEEFPKILSSGKFGPRCRHVASVRPGKEQLLYKGLRTVANIGENIEPLGNFSRSRGKHRNAEASSFDWSRSHRIASIKSAAVSSTRCLFHGS